MAQPGACFPHSLLHYRARNVALSKGQQERVAAANAFSPLCIRSAVNDSKHYPKAALKNAFDWRDLSRRLATYPLE